MTIQIPAYVGPIADAWHEQIKAANALGQQVIAASNTKDEDAAVKGVLNTSDDAKIVEWRERDAKVRAQIKDAESRLAEAKAAIHDHAKSLIPNVDASFDVESATAEFLKMRSDAQTMRKALLALVGGDAETLAAIVEQHNITPELVSLRKRTTVGGATGKRRPRLASVTVDDKVLDTANFTALSKVLGADVDAVKDAAFKAAGTDDLKSLNGAAFTFEFDSKTVVIVPKGEVVESSEDVADEADEDNSEVADSE